MNRRCFSPRSALISGVLGFTLAVHLLKPPAASGQLFENLLTNLTKIAGTRYPVGDPNPAVTNELGPIETGPKDIAVADFDGDGRRDFVTSHKEGTLTLYFGVGDGTFGDRRTLRTWTVAPLDQRRFYFTNYVTNAFCDFEAVSNDVRCVWVQIPPSPNGTPGSSNLFCITNMVFECVNWVTNVTEEVDWIAGPFGLRGLAVADYSNDGRPDIAVASPGEERIYVFIGLANREFTEPLILPGWFGVRDLAAGDFDGDGRVDLAAGGTTNGLVHYRSAGGGAFVVEGSVPELASELEKLSDLEDFPQPAYYLKRMRQPGDDRDELAVSHAQRGRISILRTGDEGRLIEIGELGPIGMTSMDIGPILRPNGPDAAPDLVTAYSRSGSVSIYPAAADSLRFSQPPPAASLFVPGAPRNVRILDLDMDGWNELVVVAQSVGRVLTYHNDAGVLRLASESPVGKSPREMDAGDFNGDDRPDLAVLNRFSQDVSVLITATNLETAQGFLSLDSVYPVDGGVSGLELRDFNGDGRMDVMQLHRDSSEFSVRLTREGGLLGPAAYYAITNSFQPAAQVAVDVNGDGRADMVSANLSGSVTIRLGEADGTFGPEQTFALPPGDQGSLFALAPGDFDGDGRVDLAAGYFDCRVAFFKGDGAGGFTHVRTDFFLYEPRSMAAADLDQDGDMDLVGGSPIGKFAIVVNTGDLFTRPILPVMEFEGSHTFGSNLRVIDQNGDGDPDLLFGSEGGFTLFLGGAGLTFTEEPVMEGTNDPRLWGATFIYADLDGDGLGDFANICSESTCLTIQVYSEGAYYQVLTVPIPSTRYLATDDLDGDGMPDLVGTGDVLWVALSSRPASQAAPTELLAGRGGAGVVINEVLAKNDNLPVAQDEDRVSDWIELFNGSGAPVPLDDWQLSLVTSDNGLRETNRFRFEEVPPVPARGRVVLVCSDRLRSPYHTGFKLPAEGGLLQLRDAEGEVVDQVEYPAQPSDQSYARFTDGASRFVVNAFPSAGMPNVENGTQPPDLSVHTAEWDGTWQPGQPIRFRATAGDDVGVMNVSILWRRLDVPDTDTKRIILYDDGMNEDGGINDGEFAGVLEEALPMGAEIQFYAAAIDLTDQQSSTPGNPVFFGGELTPNVHTLALGQPRLPLEISELVVDNENGLMDEAGGTPDWVEIRNLSNEAVSLDGVSLGGQWFGRGGRLFFDGWPSLAPGQHLVLYADDNLSQGTFHAPFRLNKAGERLVLTGTTALGARAWIDDVTYGPLETDRALSRLGPRGPWRATAPTPRQGNVTGPWELMDGDTTFRLAFPTRAGSVYTVEFMDELSTGWTAMHQGQGTGVEMAVEEPKVPRRFYRWVEH